MTRAEMRTLIERMEQGIGDAYAIALLTGADGRAKLLAADHKLLNRLAGRLIRRGLA